MIEIGLEHQTAYPIDGSRPRAETCPSEVSPESFASQEAELWLEVPSHFQVLEAQPIPVGGVVELARVARRVVVEAHALVPFPRWRSAHRVEPVEP